MRKARWGGGHILALRKAPLAYRTQYAPSADLWKFAC
jgi:hypothetical protein